MPHLVGHVTGAVGLLGMLAANQFGAERVVAHNRREPRQKLALEFGAEEIVTDRGGDDGGGTDRGACRSSGPPTDIGPWTSGAASALLHP